MSPEQPRKLRKDAAENAERILAAAIRTGLAEGKSVPIAELAKAAGVGTGTIYRRYPTREALLEAMSVRAYRLILAEAENALATGESGHDAIRRFLTQTFAHRDELVLPLHGAPMTVGTDSGALRQRMRQVMTAIVDRGHDDGTVRTDVNAGTVVRFGAMLAHPMSNVPDWETVAAEQRAVFLRGIAPGAG
jgi:AcrR family transcriptional regulator